jgi:hypothetical protein
VTTLRFEVAVAASPDEVRSRLGRAGDRPGDLVGWFTDDPRVDASVTPAGPGWRVQVQASAFAADAVVTVGERRPSGAIVAVDGQVKGRGLMSLATPALRLAVPRIEAEARRSLHREFGDPDGGRR